MEQRRAEPDTPDSLATSSFHHALTMAGASGNILLRTLGAGVNRLARYGPRATLLSRRIETRLLLSAPHVLATKLHVGSPGTDFVS